MATVKISQLPAASDTDYVDGTVFPIVSSVDNTTKKANLSDLRANYLSDVKSASLTIASADVLTLNTTPLTIVPAVSGKAIEVISASVKIDFNSAAYATNTNIALTTSGATTEQYGAAILNATVSTHKKLQEVTSTTATTTQMIVNADLQVTVKTGDPTAGDSDIEVFVLYREI